MRARFVGFVIGSLVACTSLGTSPATSEPPVVPTPPGATPPDATPPPAEPQIAEAPPVEPEPSREPATPPASEPTTAYDRGAWQHWIDADGDCQDTRTEVLVAEAIGPVVFTDAKQCEVASGRWRCPYTDRTFSDPRQLDVDHFVPLAEAHRSGGARWSAERRRDYANDLADPEHLVAVYRSANRSKGAHTIVDWLPDEPGSRCAYVETWLRIKQRWDLRVDEREHAAADAYLQSCAAGGVPEVAATKPPSKSYAPTAPATAPKTCCRTCKKGKPCGDACIGADKTCHAPPGCAC